MSTNNQILRLAGLAAAIALPLRLPGQSVPIPLRVSSEVAAPTLPAGVTGPVAGNHGFYTNYVSHSAGREAAIHWISEDGRRSVVYDLAAVPRGRDRQGYSLLAADYTPIPGRGLAVLGVWNTAGGGYRGESIIVFDQEGSFANAIDLSDPISAQHIASFGDGTFLVLGGAHSGTGLDTSEIYLVDSHGNVMSRHLFEKLDAPESPPPPAQDQAAPVDQGGQEAGGVSYPNTQAWQLFYKVSRTSLVSGDDSNVYVIPPDQTSKLSVVNKGGEVAQLALDPALALKSKNVIVLAAIESGGQLAIYYGVVAAHTPALGNIDFNEKLLCLYDVRIGALEATYQAADARISPFLTGFGPGKFYFLSFPADPLTHTRRPAIVVAVP